MIDTLRDVVDEPAAAEPLTVDGVSWPNMSALLVASWAEAAIAVMASATAVKLLVNLNIGLRRSGAWTRLKQSGILPDSNMIRKPFVVTKSMLFVAKDMKFGIYTTVKNAPSRKALPERKKQIIHLWIDW